MANYRAKLTNFVDEFLAGKQSFDSFQHDFAACFIDEVPENELTPEMAEQFGAIHEKIEWTTAAPTTEERSYGWLDVDDFTRWLQAFRASLTHEGDCG